MHGLHAPPSPGEGSALPGSEPSPSPPWDKCLKPKIPRRGAGQWLEWSGSRRQPWSVSVPAARRDTSQQPLHPHRLRGKLSPAPSRCHQRAEVSAGALSAPRSRQTCCRVAISPSAGAPAGICSRKLFSLSSLNAVSTKTPARRGFALRSGRPPRRGGFYGGFNCRSACKCGSSREMPQADVAAACAAARAGLGVPNGTGRTCWLLPGAEMS